jgi:hypothetical protein
MWKHYRPGEERGGDDAADYHRLPVWERPLTHENFLRNSHQFAYVTWQSFAAGDLLGLLEVFENYSDISPEIENHSDLVYEYERGLINLASMLVELLFVEDRLPEIYEHSAVMLNLLSSLIMRTEDAQGLQRTRVMMCMGMSVKELAVLKTYDQERLRDHVISPEGILHIFGEAAEYFGGLDYSGSSDGQHTLRDLQYSHDLFLWMFMPVCAMSFRHCRERHGECVELYNSVVGEVLVAEPFHFRNQALPRQANNMYWWHQKIISAIEGGLTPAERQLCTEQMLRRENWMRNPTNHDLEYAAAHDVRIDRLILRHSGLELV